MLSIPNKTSLATGLNPYIVAIGETKANIIRFYIEVERHFIPVSKGLSESTDSFHTYWIKFHSIRFVWFCFTYFYQSFQLPDSFDFARAIDVFFKIHKIFDMNFDKNISNAMYFIQHYLYDINDSEKKPTPRMEDVYNRLMRDINTAASKMVTFTPAISA